MWLVVDLTLGRPGLPPGSVHVEFVVDKVPMGQVSLPVPRFSLATVSIISPRSHIHKSGR
jgi:hypothetical protein